MKKPRVAYELEGWKVTVGPMPSGSPPGYIHEIIVEDPSGYAHSIMQGGEGTGAYMIKEARGLLRHLLAEQKRYEKHGQIPPWQQPHNQLWHREPRMNPVASWWKQ